MILHKINFNKGNLERNLVNISSQWKVTNTNVRMLGWYILRNGNDPDADIISNETSNSKILILPEHLNWWTILKLIGTETFTQVIPTETNLFCRYNENGMKSDSAGWFLGSSIPFLLLPLFVPVNKSYPIPLFWDETQLDVNLVEVTEKDWNTYIIEVKKIKLKQSIIAEANWFTRKDILLITVLI